MRKEPDLEAIKCAAQRSAATSSNCSSSFDSNMCWESAYRGSISYLECPFEFCTSCSFDLLSVKNRQATRQCFLNGTWSKSDYSNCIIIFKNYSSCIWKKCKPCADAVTDNFKDSIQTVVLSLSVISGLLLLLSLFVFCILRSIQCTRLSIHINLAAAFLIRFTSLVVWVCLWMPPQSFFAGCGGFAPEKVEWLCKLILFVIMYSTMTSIFWMFAEGLFLFTRLSMFAFRSEISLWPFAILGWGIPVPFTVVWAGLMEVASKTNSKYCWIPYNSINYKWIVIGPMLFVLFINLALLVFIVIILIQKMAASNTQESRMLWKTIRATVILMPLLGLGNLLWFHEPDRSSAAYEAYVLFNAILQHSQGILFSVTYCFLNGEIRAVCWRRLKQSALYDKMSTRSYSYPLILSFNKRASNLDTCVMEASIVLQPNSRNNSSVTTKLLSPKENVLANENLQYESASPTKTLSTSPSRDEQKEQK